MQALCRFVVVRVAYQRCMPLANCDTSAELDVHAP